VARKKVLVITYYWYPFAGVGTYRISRFVKYLLKSGWEVVILTTKNAASGMKEEPDDPILKECTVYRSNVIEPTGLLKSGNQDNSKTSNPSIFYRKNKSWKSKLAVWVRLNLMIPDAKFTWKWFAVPLGKKIIKKENPDLILSTSPPPTTNLIAKKLAEWSSLPWLADFRDPWTNIYYYDDNPQSGWARNQNKKLETEVLNRADKIILVNNGFFPEHEQDIANKSTVIPNGFDPDHIIRTEPTSTKNNKFTIRYFGSLKANQHPAAFIKSLAHIGNNYPEKAENIAFEFYGSIDPDIKKEIRDASKVIETIFHDFIPHDEMMKKVSSSDMLLLAIGRTKNSKFALSTKVFEYMISGNPVIGIGPVDGAASELVQKTNIGAFFDHEDEKGTTEFLLKAYDAAQKKEDLFTPKEEAMNSYNFKRLTEKLEQIMLSLKP
jgi:glycosyltransferase involved in cell wall biosynthesis